MKQEARYLIVGGGLAADGAARGIRAHDPEGEVLLVSEEVHPPYARPPLSKALWKGEPEQSIWRLTANLGVRERLGRRIVSLDPGTRTATDDHGEEYGYERKRFVVIGGGFIGSEIAAALALNGCPVTMVFPEPGIGARIFPEELSTALNGYYRDHGVEVLAEASVISIERDAGGARVGLGDGRTLTADGVVAGIGIEPNVELAAGAGLPVSNGIVVDELGRVGGRDDVFATGDVARFPVAALGVEMRVEHEDHAKSHGRLVGANMAGARERYDHLPFFYSDLFDAGYEAVGEVDARSPMLVDWSDVAGEGTIVYLDPERRPRGVLLWNRFGHLDGARELIRAGEPVGAHAQVE